MKYIMQYKNFLMYYVIKCQIASVFLEACRKYWCCLISLFFAVAPEVWEFSGGRIPYSPVFCHWLLPPPYLQAAVRIWSQTS